MIGLPKLDDKVTRFMPPDWYMRACSEPVVLFLDEINRATPEVMQAAFQIVLDRTLNGHTLHPETRIYAAINTNGKYQVNEMDPALLDRFWVTDLEPTDEDWLAWAGTKRKTVDAAGKEIEKTRVHPLVIDFLRKNVSCLRTGKVENSTIAPSPRSWERLDAIYKAAENLLDKDVNGDRELEQRAYSLATGMIGLETSRTLVDYLKTLERQITALDILDNFDKNQKKIEALGQEKWNICIDKLAEWMRDNVLSKKQATNVGKFITCLPDELIVHMWTTTVSTANTSETRDQNVSAIKDHIIPHIIRVTKPTVDAMRAELEKKK